MAWQAVQLLRSASLSISASSNFSTDAVAAAGAATFGGAGSGFERGLLSDAAGRVGRVATVAACCGWITAATAGACAYAVVVVYGAQNAAVNNVAATAETSNFCFTMEIPVNGFRGSAKLVRTDRCGGI